MHGEPGSGKTTLASVVAPRIPAIHLDKDVVMSAIMKTKIPRELAGPASYEVMRDVARSLLESGHSVILDSPCYWPIIEEKAKGLARATGSTYFMIETVCPDRAEIDRRLANREGLPTNPRERLDWLAAEGTREPTGARLTIDTSLPVEELVGVVLDYLGVGAQP